MSLLKNPVHPGEILKELFMIDYGLSSIALADRINVPRSRVERLVKGQTAMTVDTAVRLSKLFGNSVESWMNMQQAFDLANEAPKVDVSKITRLAMAAS